jgi:hypothetical protein
MEKESGMGRDLWLTGLQPATCDRLHQEWAGPMAHLAGPASLAGSASGVRCARGAVTVAVAGVVAWAVRAADGIHVTSSHMGALAKHGALAERGDGGGTQSKRWGDRRGGLAHWCGGIP